MRLDRRTFLAAGLGSLMAARPGRAQELTPGQYPLDLDKVRDGVLRAPVDATYPIEEIQLALVRAQQGGRNGKVLVLPNGPL